MRLLSVIHRYGLTHFFRFYNKITLTFFESRGLEKKNNKIYRDIYLVHWYELES